MIGFSVALIGVGRKTATEDTDHQDGGTDQQQATLHKLDIGGRGHTGGGNDQGNDDADDDNAHVVGQTEQRLNQNTSADHLRNQVEHRHYQGGDSGGELNTFGVKLGVESIGKGVLTKALHRLGDQEQGYHPAGQITDGVEEAVVTGGRDHAADTEEGSGREIVAGKSDAVNEPVNVSAGGVVTFGGGGATGQIEREAQNKEDESTKQGDCQRRLRINHW